LCPPSAAPIAQGLRYGFAQRDAEVLDRVMLIDIEVAGGLDVEEDLLRARQGRRDVLELQVVDGPPCAADERSHREEAYSRPDVSDRLRRLMSISVTGDAECRLES